MPGRSEARPPRVAMVLPYYDHRLALTPRGQLAAQPTLAGFASAGAEAGLTVGAFQLYRTNERLAAGKVSYAFVASPPAARWLGHVMHRQVPRHGPAYFELAWPLWQAVRQWRPDIVHVFGLTLDVNLALGTLLTGRQTSPLVAHFHGGGPEADALTRSLRERTLHRLRRAFFTAPEQAEPWIASGLLRAETVALVNETSTWMRPLPRAVARARTGMTGEPCCLLVGRLDAIKDPLNSLAAFSIVARHRPLARLYVVSQGGTLEARMRALVAAMPDLAERVHFLGPQPPERMAAIYSSADLLFQSSRREWSSLTVLEALACGVVPILTDIPAFRVLTAGGAYGSLVPGGAPEAMAGAAIAVSREQSRRSAMARAHFDRALSFPALASRLAAIYATVLDEARGVLS